MSKRITQLEYLLRTQRADGSWWYGEDSKYHWIDNFHTGYNLGALARSVAAHLRVLAGV